MRSYPKLIRLPDQLVRPVVDRVTPYAFDRIYGAFDGLVILTDARHAVTFSAQRYIGLLQDEIRDPDERGEAVH